MATKFLIKQRVSTVQKRWLEIIYETESERVAISSYEDFVRDNPDKYFELVKTETNEACILFTPFKDE